MKYENTHHPSLSEAAKKANLIWLEARLAEHRAEVEALVAAIVAIRTRTQA